MESLSNFRCHLKGFAGQRCPNGEPNCAGSTCSSSTAGQNYFLKMPCGWDFFQITTSSNGYSIWNDVVTQGWGTHCINDPFTGAAFWTFGDQVAGFNEDDLLTDTEGNLLAIRDECGQMHDFVANGADGRIGWYMEMSASGGFRSTSCGRRFLIRRPLGCVRNVPNTTIAVTLGGESTTESTVGALDRLLLVPVTPAQVPQAWSGGTFSETRLNRAAGATAWDNILQHQDGASAVNIIDGIYGDDNKWSAATESENEVDQYIYVALGFEEPVLIDTIAFGRDNSGEHTGSFIGIYTIQVTDDTFSGVESTYTWRTLGTLIYSAETPSDGSRRHSYRVSPPMPASALRIIVNSRIIVIDELEVYGMLATVDWTPVNSAQISAAAVPTPVLTDSAGFETVLIDGTEANDYNTAAGASVSVDLGSPYTLYAVSFRVQSAASTQFIRRCKIAYLDLEGQLMYARTNGFHTTDASEADYILDISADTAPDGMSSADGFTVSLPVPIETTLLRFFDIEGQPNNPIVNVQFGISGHVATQVITGVPGDPRLDVQVAASGFDDKVGCDTVQYSITVRHVTNAPGQNSNLARQLRISDMLSDSKIDLVSGSITVEKSTVSTGASATWQLMPSSLFTIVEGNETADALVIVDVDHLYLDEVLRITYTVVAKDPAPKDIISARAVIELLDIDGPCVFDEDSLRVCGLDGEVQPPAPCGTHRRAVAWPSFRYASLFGIYSCSAGMHSVAPLPVPPVQLYQRLSVRRKPSPNRPPIAIHDFPLKLILYLFYSNFVR